MSNSMIEIAGLVKKFDTITAVAGISFSVKKGEVLGFLGPNGAGKSTTMKMIAGYLIPTAGSITLCGCDVLRNPIAAQSQTGYLPEGAPAYGDMTPRQFLNFVAQVRGYDDKRKQRAISSAVARTQLEQILDQPIETLSKGFKRRVGLAQAILHDPPVLIMDEPTDGLDPNQKFAVRRLISNMAEDKAIIISTHILEEVDAVCTRAIIIDRGKIVADGTPQELAARSRYHNSVTVHIGPEHAETAREKLKKIEGVKEVHEKPLSQGVMSFTLFPRDGKPLINKVTELLGREHWDVSNLIAEGGRLDEVFRDCTTSDAKPAAIDRVAGKETSKKARAK